MISLQTFGCRILLNDLLWEWWSYLLGVQSWVPNMCYSFTYFLSHSCVIESLQCLANWRRIAWTLIDFYRGIKEKQLRLRFLTYIKHENEKPNPSAQIVMPNQAASSKSITIREFVNSLLAPAFSYITSGLQLLTYGTFWEAVQLVIPSWNGGRLWCTCTCSCWLTPLG